MKRNYDIHNIKILSVYSAIAYLFAYLIVFLFFNLITALVGSSFHIKTLLIHNNLLFLTPDNSSLWNFDNTFVIFTSSAFVLTIIAFVLIKIYNKYKEYEGLIKIFLFWIVLHIFNRILGTFVLGTVFDLYYLNVLFDWLEIEYWVRMILILIVLSITIFYIGIKTTNPLIFSTRSFEYTRSKNRLIFVEAQAFIAWFVSSVIIFLIHLPSLSYIENSLSLSMFLLILPSYFTYKHIKNLPVDNYEEVPQYKIPWFYIALILILLILFRIILRKGIPF